MDDLLKIKYYNLIIDKTPYGYQQALDAINEVENNLILSDYLIKESVLVNILEPLKEKEPILFKELSNDIQNKVIYGDSNE